MENDTFGNPEPQISEEWIHARLVAAKETAQLSARFLARQTGIPESSVLAIFNGKLLKGAARVFRLLEACGYRVVIAPENYRSGKSVREGRGP